MKKTTIAIILALGLFLEFLAFAQVVKLSTTERLSVGRSGPADDASDMPLVPLNGQKLSFQSLTTPGDFETTTSDIADYPLSGTPPEPSLSNIFVRDLGSGEVNYLSYRWYYRCLTFGGNRTCRYVRVYPDDSSFSPSISPVTPEGRYMVAFESRASNFLVDAIGSAPQSRFSQIYVYDPDWKTVYNPNTGLLESMPQDRIKAISTLPSQLCRSVHDDLSSYRGNGDSHSPSLTVLRKDSGVGLEVNVAYATSATNLAAVGADGQVSTDSNGVSDIVLSRVPFRDDQEAISPDQQRCFAYIGHTRVTVRSDGVEANGESDQPKIAGGANAIVFRSRAGNLDESLAKVDAAPFENSQVYYYDSSKKKSKLVSKNASKAPGTGDSYAPQVSYQGSKVVYLTDAKDIAKPKSAIPVSAGARVIVYTVASGASVQANTTAAGVPSDGVATSASLSPDGRFVVFTDTGDNLVPNDTNGQADVFIKDLETKAIVRVTNGYDGTQANGESFTPVVNFNDYNTQSGFVTYASLASNLVVGDTASPAIEDIFRTNFTVKTEQLSANAPLEVPADVTLNGTQFSVSMKKYTGVKTAKSKSTSTKATRKPILKYELTVRKDGTSGYKKYLSKQNKVALGNMASGTYSVQYRVLANSGKKTVAKSKLSPAQRVKVG